VTLSVLLLHTEFPPFLIKLRPVVAVPTPGTKALIIVPEIEPAFGVSETSYGVRVTPALMISCPLGKPTGK